MNNFKLSSKYLGEAALLLMTIIWGGTFVIVKESLNDISTMLFVAIRFGVAALIIGAYLYIKKYKVDKKSLASGFVLGAFLFLGFLFQTIGLKQTTATKSGFITGSLVVMVPIFQTVIEKKLPSTGAQIGTVLVFFGILFLSSGGTSITNFLSELGGSFNFGDTLTLICAAFFALHIVFMDIISPRHDFWILFVTQLVTVSVLSLLGSFIFHAGGFENIHIDPTPNLIWGLLYTSLLATCVNFGLQTKFQKVVSPTKAGIIYSFEPIFAAIFAFFLLNEKISNFGLAGSALIFSGLIVSEAYDSIFNNKEK
ncbi:MAG: DMT family transporter [Ignavibacteriales bacterium]|nr:DMT family transporter [Ignavibacteriales bacterium]